MSGRRSPVGDAIASALSDYRRSGKASRRHPAEVTSDRLGDALDRWPEHFDGAQRDAVHDLRNVLERIAEGGR
jgi:hypothetical protein